MAVEGSLGSPPGVTMCQTITKSIQDEIQDEESSNEEDNCRKKRCSDRYDSSESSDSGVAVHCGECSSSNNSDITEPCSPLSTSSSEEGSRGGGGGGRRREEEEEEEGGVVVMPPTQSQPAWPSTWGNGGGGITTTPPPSKQGKITEYFKTKSKGVKHPLPPPPPPPPTTPPSSSIKGGRRSPPSSPLILYDEKSSDSGLQLENISSPSEEASSRSSEGAVIIVPSPPPSGSSGGEERTIRFPPGGTWKGHYVSDFLCRWTHCDAKFSTTSGLIEHLQVSHVNSQTLGEYYVCQWIECKVFERKSCSRTWLERHVLSHGGNKPYRCIVDGCGHRFSSQTLLQRHVNGHFTEGSQQGSSKKSSESANKLIRRNGKKLRYRRHPFSARIYDYFDAGIMEGLQHNLIELTEKRTLGQIDSTPGHTVTLQSKVLCKRIEPNGKTKVLLRWFPSNILNDEWVDENRGGGWKREVSIPHLPSDSKEALYNLFTSSPPRIISIQTTSPPPSSNSFPPPNGKPPRKRTNTARIT